MKITYWTNIFLLERRYNTYNQSLFAQESIYECDTNLNQCMYLAAHAEGCEIVSH